MNSREQEIMYEICVPSFPIEPDVPVLNSGKLASYLARLEEKIEKLEPPQIAIDFNGKTWIHDPSTGRLTITGEEVVENPDGSITYRGKTYYRPQPMASKEYDRGYHDGSRGLRPRQLNPDL